MRGPYSLGGKHMAWTVAQQDRLTPGYEGFHQRVADACADLMGETHRHFFDSVCSYELEFAEGIDPEEVAQNQLDAF